MEPQVGIGFQKIKAKVKLFPASGLMFRIRGCAFTWYLFASVRLMSSSTQLAT